jgi:hypothetical protein
MTRRCFGLHGGHLEVEAGDPSLIGPLLPYLHELEASPCRDVRVRLLIERGPAGTPPADSECVHQGALAEGGEIGIFRHADDRWYILSGGISLQVAGAGAVLRLMVRPGAEALIGGTAGMVAIEAALAATGQALIHAAALCLPRVDRAILLVAASGAGKTTTSLALALAGFGFLTDDAAVLSPPPPAPCRAHSAWGLPRHLKVHRNTLVLLPRLATLLTGRWNAEGEQVLTRQALASVARVLPPQPRALAAILLLGKRAAERHTINEAAKADLLVSFAQDNVFTGARGVMPHELRRFEAFAAAVADTPVFELRVGTGLDTLGFDLLAALG